MDKLQRKVILLSGDGGTAFNKQSTGKYHAKLQGLKGVDVSAIGDGVKGLGQNEIDELVRQLADVKVGQSVTIIIQSHGTMKDGQFAFCIGENDKKITSKKLFDLIKTSLDGKPVDIFTEACHGGGAMADIGILPKGSQFACLVDKNNVNVGFDYHRMIDELEKFDGDLSAYNLLQHFTANYLENRHAPSIGISGGVVCNMDSYLGFGGRGETTKSQAISRASGIELDESHMAKSKHAGYKKIFDKIKSGELVYAKEYGTALSIVLNSQKNSFVKKNNKTNG